MMKPWEQKIRFAGICLLLCLCLLLCSAGTADAADPAEGEQRVFDDAELFSADQTAALETAAAALRKKMKMDVVIVTAQDARGKTTGEYADDFYDAGGFGSRNDHSGVLFLIDMDHRQLTISTAGDMIRFLTDRRIETLLDDCYVYVSDQDYSGAAESFLTSVETYFRKGIESGQYNFDTETGKISVHRSIRWYEALLAAGAAAFAAFSACASVKRQYAMKQEHLRASNYQLAYRADNDFEYHDKSDNLIKKSVAQQVIARAVVTSGHSGGGSSSGRSSTHTSASGKSHGGGSRGF